MAPKVTTRSFSRISRLIFDLRSAGGGPQVHKGILIPGVVMNKAVLPVNLTVSLQALFLALRRMGAVGNEKGDV